MHSNIFSRASKMYCKSCLEIFSRPNRGLQSKEILTHQRTAEAVEKSYEQGCDICGRLWSQYINNPDRPFGYERWYRLSTVYVLDRALDQKKIETGRSSTDPYKEKLYWSGLRYRLKFSWKDDFQSWISQPPSIEFELLAAESEKTVRLQPCLRV